ncbi:MAG: carboxypeptidase regulatory-like domain-containing protein [bacterium]|nr:carboxypeptidase regulatory-like domain-containing protein [bacterium]
MKIVESKFLCLITMTLLVIIAGNTQLVSQNGVQMSVSGTVRHADTGQPMEDVEVVILSIYNKTVTGVSFGVTDSSGYYKVKYLNAGEYKLSFNVPEKDTTIFTSESGEKDPYGFFIEEGRNVNIDIQLGESEYPYITRDESMDGANICMTTYNYKEQETPAADKIPTTTDSATVRSTKEIQTSAGKPQMTPNTAASAATTKVSSKTIYSNTVGKLTLIIKDGGIIHVPDAAAFYIFGPHKQGRCYPNFRCQVRRRKGKKWAVCYEHPNGLQEPRCEISSSGNFKITLTLTILMGSEDFLRACLMNANPNKTYSDELIKCKWQCLLKHEESHKAEGIKIAKNLFKELTDIFYSFKCCPNEQDCQTLLLELYETFKSDFNRELADTETEAEYQQWLCEENARCDWK